MSKIKGAGYKSEVPVLRRQFGRVTSARSKQPIATSNWETSDFLIRYSTRWAPSISVLDLPLPICTTLFKVRMGTLAPAPPVTSMASAIAIPQGTERFGDKDLLPN